MTKLLHQELTYAIIGAAMEVHSVLGPGFLEAVYQAALARELHLRNIPHQQQSGLEVLYKDIIAGTYRADFLVDDKVILELKAVKVLTDLDEAQLINYLKGTGYRVGLLLNFGTSSLERVRRIVIESMKETTDYTDSTGLQRIIRENPCNPWLRDL